MKLNLPMLLVVAAVALITLLGSTDTVSAQTFNPTISACLEDHTTVDLRPFEPGDPEECDGDNSPGANSDFLTRFNVPTGDVNFGAAVFFIPPEWGITPGEEIPIGAIVGQLTALATLGLINNQCDSELTVVFTMLNASIDINDTVAFADADDNGKGDVFEDKDGSGIQDGIEKYPAFIKRIIGDKQPIRRAAGIEIVAGVDVLLQFLIFEPGTPLIREIPSDESLGYPTMTFLQAIGDPEAEPEPGAITDFCSPLISSNITFGISKDNPCTDVPGAVLDPLCEVKSAPLDIPEEPVSDPDESGYVLFTNPESGTYTFSAAALGLRDADGDGFENTFDTCPFDPNQGDPRVKGDGDADEDGLDAACDPNDDPLADGTNSDEDADGYLNRQDNCPLVPNGEEEDNQKDSDVNEQGDPRPDGIGDACDPNPEVPDGDPIFAEASSELTIAGAPAAPGEEEGGGGGLGTGAIIGIVIGIIAAVVVVGGGAVYFMRRGGA